MKLRVARKVLDQENPPGTMTWVYRKGTWKEALRVEHRWRDRYRAKIRRKHASS